MKKQKTRTWIAITLLAVSLTLASGCSSKSSNSPATNASNSVVSSPENSSSVSPSDEGAATDDSPSESPSSDEQASEQPSDSMSASPSSGAATKPSESQANPEPRSGGKPAQPSATDETGINPYEVAGIDDQNKFETFFADVQALVGADDKEKLANYIQYPMHFFEGGKKDAPIKDSKAFIAAYDRIFTKEIKETIKTTTLADLFVNYKGINLGSGAVWFSANEKGNIGIMTVNQSSAK